MLLKLHLIAMQLAFISSTLASAAPSVPGVPVARAQSFVDSIGVNTHLGYTGTPYYRFRRVERALERLGVHYIRDGILPDRPDVDARFRALAARGIKLDALVGEPTGGRTVGQQLAVIERRIGAAAIASLEGPNEFDNGSVSNWVPLLRDWTKRLWHDAKRSRALHSRPVLAPTFVDPASREALGDISAWTSFGNMHPYPGGNPPDETAHFESEFGLAALNTPGEPVQATETGYTTAIDSTDNQPPVSEAVAGIYMPRLLLENFSRGIVRTYIYALLDERSDPGANEGAAGFGLLRANFKPKPAFTAVRNLISLLADPGPARRPGKLEYVLEGVPAETRQVLLQKNNGNFFLAIWNPVSVWDTESGSGWTPPAVEGTLRLAASARTVSLYEPNRSRAPIEVVDGAAEVSVPVGPAVTIVAIRTRPASR